MLDRFRHRLASVDALPQLAILGLASGLLAGGVIVLFRLAIEHIQVQILPDGSPEHYETLSLLWRFALPVLGGIGLGVVFQYLTRSGSLQVGVAHVLERMAYHQGHLPLRNFLLQFFGAAASIICGHSVGREGPGIHLGAASGSLMGQWLKLPNNSIQTLVACGAAAAIAASFNTPMAGVVFSMEVIMMEYTIAGFTPVILAAVSATALTRLIFGSEPAFSVPPLEMASLLELPYLLVVGLVIGALAAAFIALLKNITVSSDKLPIWLRFTLAGLITGLLAMAIPEIMAVGYDSVTQAMLGELGAGLLFGLVIAKLLASAIGLGLGLPGGLIGPTLVIGAAAGGLLGILAGLIYPGDVASAGFYAMLGMAAMMGATLQAPLAALVTLLELTANPNIILPGMLAVIASGMTASHVFGQRSVFITMLRARGLDYQHDPVSQSLRRTGVTNVMSRAFVRTPSQTQHPAKLLKTQPNWILIEDGATPKALLSAADLAHYLASPTHAADTGPTDLLAIPAERYDLTRLHQQATLQQALDSMNEAGVDALVVTGRFPGNILGIITRSMLESHYRS